jgi:hypothetical protein
MVAGPMMRASEADALPAGRWFACLNSRWASESRPRPSGHYAAACGSQTVKAVPACSLLSTSIQP